jgi:hypothetical protein
VDNAGLARRMQYSKRQIPLLMKKTIALNLLLLMAFFTLVIVMASFR